MLNGHDHLYQRSLSVDGQGKQAANGIVNVTAKDKATAKEQKITITASSGLSKEEVEKMREDAEAHAQEDKKRREAIEVKNTADSLTYTAEKALKDAGEKVSTEIKKDVEEKIAAVNKVKTGDNITSVVVKESQVKNGETINLELTAKDPEK